MVIYLITNTKNGKRYVGLDRTPFQRRWKDHLRHAQVDAVQLIDRKIAEHGVEHFTYEEISTTDNIETLKAQEQRWIKELNTYVGNGKGYNLTLGGDGCLGFKMPPDKIRKGKSHYMHGKKQSAESNRKRSEAMKRVRAMTVNPFTLPEVRAKVSAHAKTRTGITNPNYRNGTRCKSPIAA